MKKDAITLTMLAGRLERAIHCDVGLKGLETLLSGWMRRGNISRQTLHIREQRDGEPWLTQDEAAAFSRYAGYDLTKD